MKRLRGSGVVFYLSFLLAGLPGIFFSGRAFAQDTFTTLYTFNSPNGGANPSAALVQGADGNLYGTTTWGGIDPYGTVFKITLKGTLTSLHSFAGYPGDGEQPLGRLVQAADGSFYGTTNMGGAHSFGTIFKISTSGALTILYSFCAQKGCADGDGPAAGLIQAADGNFYGITSHGGANGDGTVFKVTSSGTLTTLHSFGQADGSNPQGALVEASDGNLYGTTTAGGANGQGTIFRITPSGALTTLYSFCSLGGCADGDEPAGALIQGSDGNFYGTTFAGGTNDWGTVFKVTRTGKLTTLHSFDDEDGASPTAGLVQGTDGNFYGTTSYGGAVNSGTMFAITPSGTLTNLHNFCSLDNCTDGDNPFAGVLQDTNGSFYGTNYYAGDGSGTVYRLAVGLGPFVSFVRNRAKTGQRFEILGQGFKGTSSVSLNGTPTSFTVVSETLIRATVPKGATTGYVTVATPSGTLTSNVRFQVIP